MLQYRLFLEDYASSPSGRTEIVDENTWGGKDTLGMAANFLQRNIFVIKREESPHKEWICRKFSPHTVTRQNRVVEIYKERPLSIEACLDEILARKIVLHGDPPILLWFWGRHYSAFVHSGTPATLPDLDEEEAGDDTSKGTTVKDESGTTLEKSTVEGSPNSRSLSEAVSMEGPWDPTTWNGNAAELWQRMEGFSMHHELKKEIYAILTKADPYRHRELIIFLASSASSLSLEEQGLLFEEVHKAENEASIRKLLQKYQVSIEVLQQWKQQPQDGQRDDMQRVLMGLAASQSCASLSDSSYYSSSQSQQTSEAPFTPPVGTSKALAKVRKRGHIPTPA
ncbi:hypothetical protein PI125_g16931 [Phytophthora idaei]|nr:hypothetical protein PI125_g16931 [Phytophthora idaei]